MYESNNLYFCNMISQRILQEQPDKDVVYFRNSYENAVLKQVKEDGIYVKFKGGKEFFAPNDSGVVVDAIMEAEIDYIDKTTYEKW